MPAVQKAGQRRRLSYDSSLGDLDQAAQTALDSDGFVRADQHHQYMLSMVQRGVLLGQMSAAKVNREALHLPFATVQPGF